ncbi:acyl dehydratase [Candidatus Photodesmus katoptron]|uniref:MaoC like protein n=1 Tax=Candidatus Photodesmus katoptron Akat1 TaxID=1236703 RepID=S3DKB8_9GAMM|nr:MaoC family dehydratase [Candidatus Photodesmus katoptron]EPE37584.1 MaoC like protein [Candidatus Photodesmus katoptron Akat1]KEY90699.1 acyl dehydratase [Candidatus Photodesmus katoptron]
MKVTSFFKNCTQSTSKKNPEFPNWMPPTLREYWEVFFDRKNTSYFFSWVRDLQKVEVNNIDIPVLETFSLNPEAQIVYSELQNQIGAIIHVGDWMRIDQNRIDQFAKVTEDMQWIHTDPKRAKKESPYKSTVAHGFLTLSLLPRLTDSSGSDTFRFPTARMIVNVGLNQVRFPYPVKSGNNIRAKSKLLNVVPIKKSLRVEREIQIEIEGIRRPACILISVIQLYF